MDILYVPIVGILQDKHHQESYDRRSSIDDQLPGIRVSKYRPGNQPDRYDDKSDDESLWSTAVVWYEVGYNTISTLSYGWEKDDQHDSRLPLLKSS